MAENSAIEWTDHTFNPWEGCQKVGPGCDNCYAEARNARFGTPKGQPPVAKNWGPGAPRRRTSPANWRKPLRWQADAARFLAEYGRRQRVFCASLADVFDNAADPADRADLFALIRRTPDLDWLLLTKRIGNAAAMAAAAGGWPDNVWLGATIVNQAEAERDIPKLLAIMEPRIRFLSMEPLLGPVSLTGIDWHVAGYRMNGALPLPNEPDDFRHHMHRTVGLNWIIVGGESGPGARPMHPDWVRSLREQCAAAGVPFLFKQWGEWGNAFPVPSGTPGHYAIATPTHLASDFWPSRIFKVDAYPRMFDLFGGSVVRQRVGKKAAGRMLDGVQHDGVPA